MEKIDKVIAAGIILAAAGIVIFWMAGFNGNLEVSKWSLLAAGGAAFVADLCFGLKLFRRWQRGY